MYRLAVVTLVNRKVHHEPTVSNPCESVGKKKHHEHLLIPYEGSRTLYKDWRAAHSEKRADRTLTGERKLK